MKSDIFGDCYYRAAAFLSLLIETEDFMEPFTAALVITFAFAMLLLWREGLLHSKRALILAAVLTAAALAARAWLYPFESGDYLGFLQPWTEFFRKNGGFKALASFPGNYNPPYMYFLAAFSYFDISELYLIKTLSVLFDVLLAWSCMKLLSVFTDSKPKMMAAFFVILYMPTVMTNGAYWAQCDSIYTFFAIYALYLGLRGKGAGSMISLAASLAFKLQAVFIIPAFFVLLLGRRIKWQHLLVFPAAYVVFMLPAAAAGKPLLDALTLYVSQAGTVGDAMNYNAPSLTSMFSWSGDTAHYSVLLILAAFALVIAVYTAAIIYRRRLSDRVILGLTLVLAIGIPFMLPHMHDRYFYVSGMLTVVLAFSDVRFLAVPVFAELASLHCYYAYFSRHYLVQPRIGGEFMLFALLLCIAYTAVYIQKSRNFKITS